MQYVVHAETANEVWSRLASKLAELGDDDLVDGRGGRTVELLHVGLSIENPRQRWVSARQPALNLPFALAEVLWILSGRRDAGFLTYWNSQLPAFVGTSPELHGAYGFRLRNHFGFDQLDRAASALSATPSSRQVILQVWDPTIDLPSPDGVPASQDVPCNVMSLLKVRKGCLEWMQIVRSNDIFRGLPYNIVQFTFLQEILAGWLGLQPGTYSQVSDSLHSYEHDLASLRSSSTADVAPSSDHYDLPKDSSHRVISEMVHHASRFIAVDLTEEELSARVSASTVPAGYANMLRILAAESARRRGWLVLAHRLGAACTNPALEQMWARWCEGRSRKPDPSETEWNEG